MQSPRTSTNLPDLWRKHFAPPPDPGGTIARSFAACLDNYKDIDDLHKALMLMPSSSTGGMMGVARYPRTSLQCIGRCQNVDTGTNGRYLHWLIISTHSETRRGCPPAERLQTFPPDHSARTDHETGHWHCRSAHVPSLSYTFSTTPSSVWVCTWRLMRGTH